jgi:undecaprenyl diphosphate synthase
MNIRFVVFGIFAYNHKFLLYKEIDEVNNEEFYRPVGGGVDFQESSEDALSREIYEEIGEKVTNIRELGVLENVFNFRGVDQHQIYKGFFAEFENPEVYATEKIYGTELDGTKFTAEWMDLETLLDEKTVVYPRGLKEILINKFTVSNKTRSYKTDKLHLAIIPDGSRRWSKDRNLSFYEGYSVMVKNLRNIVDYSFSQNVEVISLYLASAQNFLREQSNVEAFARAESEFCSVHLKELLDTYSIKVIFSGSLDSISDSFRKSIQEIVELTKDNSDLQINLCVAYCPVEEVFDAAKKSFTKDEFFINLSINQPVDILIRTGFSNAISNFLPLQNGYARIYFIDKLINDVTNEDVQAVLDQYNSTERRFGR